MEEVASLYTRMPDITATAQRGLQENKATMERIMQNSSTVLSKKIKGFEKVHRELPAGYFKVRRLCRHARGALQAI